MENNKHFKSVMDQMLEDNNKEIEKLKQSYVPSEKFRIIDAASHSLEKDKEIERLKDNYDDSETELALAHSCVKTLQSELTELKGLTDIEVKHCKTLLASCEKALSERDAQLTELKEKHDEFILHFIDWFGTWQTDKRLEDYGINDIKEQYYKQTHENK